MANQKRRDQLATAALDLFDQRGYHGTGMEDIAKAVAIWSRRFWLAMVVCLSLGTFP